MKNLAFIFVALLMFQLSHAVENDEQTDKQLESLSKSEVANNYWANQLKTKYNLTDEQVTKLQTSSISKTQMAMVAELAQKSNKSIDDVLKMRIDDKMGWGKIAKELGLHPKTIGQSVSQMRRETKEERRKMNGNAREDKQQSREDRKEKHDGRGGGNNAGKNDKKDK